MQRVVTSGGKAAWVTMEDKQTILYAYIALYITQNLTIRMV
jgi:hypothetical protein